MSYQKIALFSALFALILAGCSFRTAPSSRSSAGGAGKIGKNSPATMRPYKINGKTYYPEQVSVGDTQIGIASWYGPNFHGKYTSNVRINDRGPFVDGRIIDLSKTAANLVGVFAKGTAPVKLEVVGFYGRTIAKGSPKATIVGGNFMVQIGAFRNRSGAQIYQRDYHGTAGYPAIIKEFSIDGAPIYRVFLSGFKSEDEARDFAHNGKFTGAFIVRE